MLFIRKPDEGAKGCVHNCGSECSALSRFRCKGGKPCSLYQTEDDLERSKQKAIKRLCSLPEDRQTEIADRLFRGHMPWKGDGDWLTRADY